MKWEPPFETIRAFKESSDDWYGNYEIKNDQRHEGRKYVEVSILPLMQPEGARVCVWGNDDCGMEKDFFGEGHVSEARKEFLRVVTQKILSKELLEQAGFNYA